MLAGSPSKYTWLCGVKFEPVTSRFPLPSGATLETDGGSLFTRFNPRGSTYALLSSENTKCCGPGDAPSEKFRFIARYVGVVPYA